MCGSRRKIYSDRNKAHRQLSLQNSRLSQVSSKHTTIAPPPGPPPPPLNFRDQIPFGTYSCVFKLCFVTNLEQEPMILTGLAFNKNLNLVTFLQLQPNNDLRAACRKCGLSFLCLQYVNLPFLCDSLLLYALDIYLFIIKYCIVCLFLLLICSQPKGQHLQSHSVIV